MEPINECDPQWALLYTYAFGYCLNNEQWNTLIQVNLKDLKVMMETGVWEKTIIHES